MEVTDLSKARAFGRWYVVGTPFRMHCMHVPESNAIRHTTVMGISAGVHEAELSTPTLVSRSFQSVSPARAHRPSILTIGPVIEERLPVDTTMEVTAMMNLLVRPSRS